MAILRWGLIVLLIVTTGAAISSGVVNGLALLALILAVAVLLTFPKIRERIARAVVTADPFPELSRLDYLDRGCCLVDHSDATDCLDPYDEHERTRRAAAAMWLDLQIDDIDRQHRAH